MKRLRVAVLMVCVLPSLNGCFLLFIPGSVVSAASDAITGASGTNCVGSNAKVGENVRMSDGTMKQVKSLSGTSTRCQDSNLPIRPELVAVDQPAVVPPAPLSPQLAAIDVNLPAGWEKKPMTEVEIAQRQRLKAYSQSSDSWVGMWVTSRQETPDLGALANARKSAQMNKLTGATATGVTHTGGEGRDTYQWVVVGEFNKVSYTFHMTLVGTGNVVVILNTWTSTTNIDGQRSRLDKLTENLVGVT